LRFYQVIKQYLRSKHLARSILIDLLRWIFNLLFRLLTRTSVSGKENLPKEGGYIVASNHLSEIEVPLVYLILNRKDATALIADKHQKNPFFRWLVNTVGGIWINREEADIDALRAARDHLRKGGVLGIAPEGTRSPTGSLIQAKTGTAYLAEVSSIPIVPVGVTGTWKALPKVFTFKRPRITVRFGEPFSLPKVDRRNRDADLQRNTDEIMCQIAVLLPPEYRGVYSQHPRLAELLENKATHHRLSDQLGSVPLTEGSFQG
jgi:1-acyl-sn-glycerol-3-phosphate acyltransferase